jgi:hypothetical protein
MKDYMPGIHDLEALAGDEERFVSEKDKLIY